MKTLILVVLSSWIQLSFGQRITIGQVRDSFYIYKNDSLLLDIGFTEVAAFSEGKTWVNLGDKYAYMDSNGAMLTEFKYDVVSGFKNGFAMVAVDSLYGFINSEGLEITTMKYDRIRNFRDGFADVQLDELWGAIDTGGTEVVDPAADLPLLRLGNKHFAMKYQGQWGVVDLKGRIVVPFSYDCILPDGTAFKDHIPSKLTLPETPD